MKNYLDSIMNRLIDNQRLSLFPLFYIKDKWDVIRAGGITVAQGYKCRKCGVIYGNTLKDHCKYEQS